MTKIGRFDTAAILAKYMINVREMSLVCLTNGTFTNHFQTLGQKRPLGLKTFDADPGSRVAYGTNFSFFNL